MDQQSIPPSSFGSTLETKKVWMNYHLQRGDIHMARKIANKISDADIAARIKRLRRNPNHPLSSQDEIESFRNISNLKKEFSKKYGIHTSYIKCAVNHYKVNLLTYLKHPKHHYKLQPKWLEVKVEGL